MEEDVGSVEGLGQKSGCLGGGGGKGVLYGDHCQEYQ